MSMRKTIGHSCSLLLSSFFQTSFGFTFFHPLNCHLCFPNTSSLKDHLLQVLEAADPVIPTKSNSQQSHFWHSSQKSHILFMLNSLLQLETSIFPPPFSSFGKKCRLGLLGLFGTVLLPRTACQLATGDTKNRRSRCVWDLVCELPDSGRQIFFF